MNSKSIYKVKIQKIYTGTRIEGVDCKVYLFQSKKKAYEFAYTKALEYSKENDNEIPDEEKNENKDENKDDSDNIDNQLKVRSEYTWSDNDYGEYWPKCIIQIEKDILHLDQQIVQVISLNI